MPETFLTRFSVSVKSSVTRSWLRPTTEAVSAFGRQVPPHPRKTSLVPRVEGKQKLIKLRVSGRFELSRVRVTEGKITVNVYENPGEINFGSS